MRLLTFGFIAFVLSITFLQAQTVDCMKDFDFLVDKIKADYPGFNDKINPLNASKLKTLEKELRNKIQIYPDSCSFYLKQYASFFKDNHLRVGRVSPEQKRPEKTDISSFGRNIEINIDSLKNMMANSKTIEGIWTSWGGDIAVIKSHKPNTFLGVAIKYRNWMADQVMFEFIPVNDTTFTTVVHSTFKESTPRNGAASLHVNNNILEIHDDISFVRKTGSPAYDKAVLLTYIPQFPNGRNTFFVATSLGDSTFYLRVPGFSGFKAQIEKTISLYRTEIMSRPNMIIDIRNNGGGLDDEYQSLSKLIYTNPYETKGVEWYASAGNIKIFEDALKTGEIRNGEEGIQWTKALLAEMKKNIGGFVVHPFQTNKEEVHALKDSVYNYPKRVGIIINEGNASSAEQFLLGAKNSKKVTLFGNQSTAGVLDYSNAIQVIFPSGNYKLNYPMTRSKRLPENPIDNIGIKPDLFIPFPPSIQLYDRLDPWVYFVKNYLEFKGMEKSIN